MYLSLLLYVVRGVAKIMKARRATAHDENTSGGKMEEVVYTGTLALRCEGCSRGDGTVLTSASTSILPGRYKHTQMSEQM